MPGQDQRGEMLCHSTAVTIRSIDVDPAKFDYPPSNSNQTKTQPSTVMTFHIYIFDFIFNFYKKTPLLKMKHLLEGFSQGELSFQIS